MFKRVDVDVETPITGFSWANMNGDIESVKMDYNSLQYVDVEDSDEDTVTFYKEDIPKLIKALQAAYDFKGN